MIIRQQNFILLDYRLHFILHTGDTVVSVWTILQFIPSIMGSVVQIIDVIIQEHRYDEVQERSNRTQQLLYFNALTHERITLACF